MKEYGTLFERERKTEVLGEQPVRWPLRPPQVKRGLAWNRFRAFVTRTTQPTVWTLAERTSSRTSALVTFHQRRLSGDQTTDREMGGAHSTHGRMTVTMLQSVIQWTPRSVVNYTNMLWSTKRRVIQSRSAATFRTGRITYLRYPTTNIAM